MTPQNKHTETDANIARGTKIVSPEFRDSPWIRLANWNKTYDPYHLPKWFLMRARAFVRIHGGAHLKVYQMNFPYSLQSYCDDGFDHWGSVKMPKEKERAVYAMPYTTDRNQFDQLAEMLGLTVEILPASPWNSSTMAFLLRAKKN